MASGHIFIFHDEKRPKTVGDHVVMVKGRPGEEDDYTREKKFFRSVDEIATIRTRWPWIDACIRSEPLAPTHLWLDPARGISRSTLEYVLRYLSQEAPDPQGKNQLQQLSDICCIVWSLSCDREPFRRMKDSILDRKKREGEEHDGEAGAKWLSIIAFVFGGDELKLHLKDLVWLSSTKLQCSIEELETWVNGEREQKLEAIYTDFHEWINNRHLSQLNSKSLARIHSDLSEAGVDLVLGWRTHRKKGILLTMSPQKLTNMVLGILQNETRDNIEDTGGDGKRVQKSSEVVRTDGQRTGRGGVLWEICKTICTPPHKYDPGTSEIHKILRKAEGKRKEWEDLEQDIDELIRLRNNKRREWFHEPDNMNVRSVSPVDTQG